MQPNYNEMALKQQQDYQKTRNPFEYGRQVAQRRYSEIMSELDSRRQATQQSYGDLYSQARQQAVRGQAAGGPTLSGGMGQQQRDFVSAIEMQQLGQIGQAREGAMRDLFSQGQAAFSNAELEGQQATQMQLQNQQTELQLVQQRQSILENPSLSSAQKAEQLEALGTTPEAVAEKQRTWDQYLVSGALTVAGGGALVVGAAKLGTVLKGAGAISQIAKLGGVTVKSVTTAMSGAKAVGVGLGLGKVGTFLAASMAAHPVGWAIGAIVVGALAVSAISGAVRNS
jgi:hypothetical protein